MAFSIAFKHTRLALAMFYILISLGKFGKPDETLSETAVAGVLADEYLPGQAGANQKNPQTGTADNDPDHIVNEALLCFNEKQIYISCDEAYKLSLSGDLNVPREHTDEYCNGPCLSETNLVLNCIEGILLHFQFYNQATISDVRETIKSGCSYGPKRGDFNVAERVQEEHSNARRTINFSSFLSGLVLIIMTILLSL